MSNDALNANYNTTAELIIEIQQACIFTSYSTTASFNIFEPTCVQNLMKGTSETIRQLDWCYPSIETMVLVVTMQHSI